MATDQSRARLVNKRILPVDVFKDNLLEYLRTEIKSVLQFNYNNDGILNLAGIPVTADVAANQIDVGLAAAPEGSYQATTGSGFLMKFGTADARLQNIKIPAGVATVYSVGLETAEIDEGVETNPRTGELEYRKITEAIGRKREPTAINYAGGVLTMRVDSVFDGTGPTAKDHAGRKVRVWLKSTQDGGTIGPKSSIEAVAFEELTVTHVTSGPFGVANIITLAGLLGQTGTPNTTVTNYWVQLIGPTVTTKTVEDLIGTSGAIFLAEVTQTIGGGVIPGGNISTAAQRIIAFSLADTSDVLRRDVHGFVKIRVKADSLDNGEPQIEVYNFSGSQVFGVTEKGDVTAIGKLLIGKATSQAAAIAARLQTDAAASGVSAYTLSFQGQDGSAAASRIYVGPTGKLFLTGNCSYSGIVWTKDDPAVFASLVELSSTTLSYKLRKAATAGSWDDASWEIFPVAIGSTAYSAVFNGMLQAGDALLSAESDVAIARLFTKYAASFKYTKVWQSSQDSGGTATIYRMYVQATNGFRIIFTTNAEWDGSFWNKDVPQITGSSTMFAIGHVGDINTEPAIAVYVKDGTSGTWADGAWTFTPFALHRSTTVGEEKLDLQVPLILTERATSPSSPAASKAALFLKTSGSNPQVIVRWPDGTEEIVIEK